MLFLRTLTRRRAGDPAKYPFSVPIIRRWQDLRFRQPVTFLVGENGCGKSTLLEAIAAGAKLPTVGSADAKDDPTLAEARLLASALEFGWARRTHRGFFLRAEDFFAFGSKMKALAESLEAQAEEFQARYDASPLSEGFRKAAGVSRGQRAALVARYGEDLNARSHGESFLTLFQARLVPGGLYLLDEPETPLSPLRQLALMSLIKRMVAQDCQFLIATHSPILMAYPEAEIWLFEDGQIRPAAWDEVEHVSLTRAFLADPQAFLRRL